MAVRLPQRGRPESARRAPLVLLVEDERCVRVVQRELLEQEGYAVVEAGSADEALLIASAGHGIVDILVTDLTLPGMQGPELAQRLLADAPWLGVVFTSGYADDDALVERFPGSVFVQKPFTIEEFASAVDTVAASRAAA